MALQTTMGPANDVYVTKTAFYWSIGIIILLLAAISFSMARDITRLTATERSPVSEISKPSDSVAPGDWSGDLPPLPPTETEAPAQ